MNYDVVFAGNGILATSAALELLRRQPTLKVAVVGPDARAGGASKAAGAMLNCFAEITKYTLSSRAARAKFSMCRAALELWPEWLEFVNERRRAPPLAMLRGTVVIENAVSGYLDSENFDAILATLCALKEPHEFVSGDDIAGLNPVPPARPFRAVRLPREGSIDSAALYEGVCTALSELGATFVHEPVGRLAVEHGRVSGVVLANGDVLSAGAVVCAAGAFTTALLDPVVPPTSVQPVFAGAGVAMTVRRHPGPGFTEVVRTVNRAGSCGLHLVPLAADRDYVGATNVLFSAPQTEASLGLCHFLLQCAIDQLDQGLSARTIVEWRVGNRPVTLDTFPLIGWSDVDGLYIMTGTYRDGFHGSPLIARIAASELLGTAPEWPHPFQPTRRPISTLSANESASECVYHATRTGFEASLVLPRLWRHEQMQLLFTPLVTRLYDRLRTRQGLPPDLVPFLAGSCMSEGPDAAAFERVRTLLTARGMSDDLDDPSGDR